MGVADTKLSAEQLLAVEGLTQATAAFAIIFEKLVPDGPDKKFGLDLLKDVGAWGIAAIAQAPAGSSA